MSDCRNTNLGAFGRKMNYLWQLTIAIYFVIWHCHFVPELVVFFFFVLFSATVKQFVFCKHNALR